MSPRELIDRSVAKRVGRIVAGNGPDTTPELREQVRADFRTFTTQADELVRSFTGLDPAGDPPEPVVVGRNGWMEANIDGLAAVLRPLGEKLAARPLGPARRLASAAIGAQVGALLGYLSQKVLGQYDLVLAAESDTGGVVYYVGPNVVEAERRWDLDPQDFRLWITIHEITHRTQFVGVPWLRDRMRALLEEALGSMDLDPDRLRAILDRGRQLLVGGPAAWRSVNVMDLLMSDQQKATLAEMQALMCVVEGHGTFVMNRIGRERIETFSRMNDAINSRRGTARGAERAFQRAIGMEMKYQQYKLGEEFMEQVAQHAGVDAVNMVWRSPADMPTMDEMRDPEGWLRRVGA